MKKAASAKGRKPGRAQDRQRAAKQKLDQLPAGVWREVREESPAPVREFVDLVAVRGASLADVYLLQAMVFREAWVQHAAAAKMRADALARNETDHTRIPGATTIGAYQHSMTQALKHMRQIAELMGPSLTSTEMPVRIPEGLDSDSIAAVLDGIEPSEILD